MGEVPLQSRKKPYNGIPYHPTVQARPLHSEPHKGARSVLTPTPSPPRVEDVWFWGFAGVSWVMALTCVPNSEGTVSVRCTQRTCSNSGDHL